MPPEQSGPQPPSSFHATHCKSCRQPLDPSTGKCATCVEVGAPSVTASVADAVRPAIETAKSIGAEAVNRAKPAASSPPPQPYNSPPAPTAAAVPSGNLSGHPLADPWRRVLAALADLGLFFVTFGIGWLIWAFILLWKGQTPGLQVLKLKVVDLKSFNKAGFGQMLGRSAIQFVIGLLLAPLTVGLNLLANAACMAPMFFNQNRQEVWDLMIGTSVVDLRESR